MAPSATPTSFTPEPGTYNLAKVLEAETEEISWQCAARGRSNDLPLGQPNGAPRHFAVAFSGGGIRSACVALGIVQSLAKKRMLMQAHYLSGISGGGYLLGWLTAWIKREGALQVEDKLAENTDKPARNSTSGTHQPQSAPGEYDRFIEPQTIHHLRRYSSYLTPRMGLFSGDTLAMASIYLRNVLLNQVMLIAALMALTLFLQLFSPEILWLHPLSPSMLTVESVVIGLCLLTGVGIAAWALWRVDASPGKPGQPDWRPGAAYACGIVGCLLTWHISPTFFATYPNTGTLLWFVGFLALLGLIGSVATNRWTGKSSAINSDAVTMFFSLLFAWFACAMLTIGIDITYRTWLRTGTTVYVGDSYVILGMPGILLGLVLVSYLFIGILGDTLPDSVREWLARLFGYFLASAAAIAVVLAIVLEGPLLMEWLFDAIRQGGWHAASAALLPGGWLFAVLGGVLGGKSAKTGAAGSASETGTSSTLLDRLVVAAPPIFLTGLLLLVSWGAHKLVIAVGAEPTSARDGDHLSRYTRVSHPEGVRVVLDTQITEARGAANTASNMHYQFAGDPSATPAASSAMRSWSRNSGVSATPSTWWPSLAHWLRYALLLLSSIALALVLAIRLSVNEFSMHLFYRNRLARAFLGASDTGRKPNLFTGFAEDDMRLDLLTSKPDDNSSPYDGPYPLWGTTLNLTSGEDLAWQQRKGASFLYSPLFSGWDYVPSTITHQQEKPQREDCKAADGMLPYGYRSNVAVSCSVPGYGGFGGQPTIGTAMAASGAAASPNMGYHTRPGVAALLAIFNVRLGWWTGNPRDAKGWAEYSPSAGYLLKELFGSANDRSKYVYLSDGGHFENLGLYELVRRRVRLIISSDADADEGFAFQDLGNAVERCRRDFGVEIEIRAQSQFKLDSAPFRAGHYAIGRINYPDGGESGILLYIKSSLTNDEPSDVLAIRSQHRDFPHDTTGNQFFDEPLFEAYRALGQHMMDCVLDKVTVNKGKVDWTVDTKAFAPPARVAALFQFLGGEYERLSKVAVPAEQPPQPTMSLPSLLRQWLVRQLSGAPPVSSARSET